MNALNKSRTSASKFKDMTYMRVMKKNVLDLYPSCVSDAKKLQENLRDSLHIQNDFGAIQHIAGVDVGYDYKKNQSKASVVVLDYQTLEIKDQAIAFLDTPFPYVPGLLSFRELPVIVNALQQLSQPYEMIMVDGQGIAHPRQMGIATHLGLVLDVPTIGVAKSRLYGQYEEPGDAAGNAAPLYDTQKQIIGYVLRSKQRCKPLFISPGHRVDVETALEMTQHCLKKYRLPEPTRLADKLSKVSAKEKALL